MAGSRVPLVWFSLGKQDIGEELRLLNERLDRMGRTLIRNERKQEITMALVAIEQGDLDSIAVTITQVADTLQAVLDSETPLSPADESGVKDALIKLQSVGPRVPTNPAPVPSPEPTPEPTPEPVVTDPAAGDQVVTDPAAGDTVVTDPAADDGSTTSGRRRS